MGAFDRLSGCAGSWRGTSRLQDPDDRGTLRVVMYNVTPDEQEELAVDATYTRA